MISCSYFFYYGKRTIFRNWQKYVWVFKICSQEQFSKPETKQTFYDFGIFIFTENSNDLIFSKHVICYFLFCGMHYMLFICLMCYMLFSRTLFIFVFLQCYYMYDMNWLKNITSLYIWSSWLKKVTNL